MGQASFICVVLSTTPLSTSKENPMHNHFTRRTLLQTLVSGLCGLLCCRTPAAHASHPPAPTGASLLRKASKQTSGDVHTYVYDAQNRLTKHSVSPGPGFSNDCGR